MGKRIDIIVALCALVLLGACGIAPSPTPLPALSASVVPGRYAVQWSGYLGVWSGTPFTVQLAFVDVFPPGKALERPTLNNPVFVGDHGEIAAEAITTPPSSAYRNYRLFTVTLRATAPPIGSSTFSMLRYVDESAQQRELAIGTWHLDSRAPGEAALRDRDTSLGATRFGDLFTTLQNPSSAAITVRGLDFDLPSLTVTTTMSEQATNATPEPVSPQLRRRSFRWQRARRIV